jgi:TM2 domain-containing membrane protein YozV
MVPLAFLAVNGCGFLPYRTRATDPPAKINLSIDGTLIKSSMAGQGSAGNVLAALCSFFIPGLGQLLQGRLLMAIVQFCLAAILWFVLLGWVIHLWSILDAALFKPAQ